MLCGFVNTSRLCLIFSVGQFLSDTHGQKSSQIEQHFPSSLTVVRALRWSYICPSVWQKFEGNKQHKCCLYLVTKAVCHQCLIVCDELTAIEQTTNDM